MNGPPCRVSFLPRLRGCPRSFSASLFLWLLVSSLTSSVPHFNGLGSFSWSQHFVSLALHFISRNQFIGRIQQASTHAHMILARSFLASHCISHLFLVYTTPIKFKAICKVKSNRLALCPCPCLPSFTCLPLSFLSSKRKKA